MDSKYSCMESIAQTVNNYINLAGVPRGRGRWESSSVNMQFLRASWSSQQITSVVTSFVMLHWRFGIDPCCVALIIMFLYFMGLVTWWPYAFWLLFHCDIFALMEVPIVFCKTSLQRSLNVLFWGCLDHARVRAQSFCRRIQWQPQGSRGTGYSSKLWCLKDTDPRVPCKCALKTPWWMVNFCSVQQLLTPQMLSWCVETSPYKRTHEDGVADQDCWILHARKSTIRGYSSFK